METRRIEKAFLLPVALGKAQFGAWVTAALDEALVNHGDCLNPVELWLDRSQLRREPQPFNAWRPRGQLQPLAVPTPVDVQLEWPLALGAVLGLRKLDALVLELLSRAGDEEVRFLAFDACLFDEQREWKDAAVRDRLLHLTSQALVAKASEPVIGVIRDEPPRAANWA